MWGTLSDKCFQLLLGITSALLTGTHEHYLPVFCGEREKRKKFWMLERENIGGGVEKTNPSGRGKAYDQK
jgi:hypothetical protein